MYGLSSVINKGNTLSHMCGNKDMLGLCRLHTPINMVADWLGYKLGAEIYCTIATYKNRIQ